jgi:hypothetical protein
MKAIAIALAALAVMTLALVGYNTLDPIRIAERERAASIASERAWLDLAAARDATARDRALAPVYDGLRLLVAVSALGGLALAAWRVFAAWHENRRLVRVIPGELQLPRRDIENGGDYAALQVELARLQAQIGAIAAAHPAGPSHLHYTYAPHGEGRAHPPAILTTPTAPPALPPVRFADLIADGTIAAGKPIVLGLDPSTNAPIIGAWRDLYSCGLGGLQGSGKSWSAAALLAQSALSGARLVICDPHAGDAESLAARVAPLAPALHCAIADDEPTIAAALDLAADELARRKRGQGERWPLIVAIDEWGALRRGPLAERLPALVEDFTTEGRKLNCHVMLLGQRWDKSAVGAFRNTLASAYIHRMRPDEARMLSGLRASDLPGDVLQLAPGAAYLVSTRGELRRVAMPHMTPADMAAVGELLAGGSSTSAAGDRAFGFRPRPAEVNGKSTGSQFTPIGDRLSAAPGSAASPPEERRILDLFLHGKSIPEIVAEVYGAVGGRRYQEARDLVERVIRRALVEVA